MNAQELVIKIIGDVTDFESKMQRLSKNLDDIGKNFSRVSTPFLIAGGAVTGALGVMVKNAADAETSTMQLSNALRVTNQYSDAMRDTMLKLATQIQNYSGISDEALQDTMRFGLQLGLNTDQVTALLPKITDFSVATGVNMETAMKMASLALEGNTGQLKRYGIEVEKNEDGTVNFNNVLDAFSGFAGSAATQGETLNGKLNIIKQQFGDLSEKLGSTLLPVIKDFIEKHIKPLIEKLSQIPIEKLQKGIEILAGVGGFLLLMGAVGKTISVFTNFAAILTNPTSGIIFAISLLVLGIIEIVKHWEDIKKAFEKFYEKYIEPWFIPLKKAFEWLLDTIGKIFGWFSKGMDKISIKVEGGTPEIGQYAGGFASGGSFTVSRPTMFLAGERGTERVNITPQERDENTPLLKEILKELRKFNEITAPDLGKKISLSVSGLGSKV